MIHRDKKEEKKLTPEYIELKSGEKLIDGDEYNCNERWTTIPSCLIGDKIPDASTKWRRPIKQVAAKKNWYEIIVKFFS